MFKKVLALFVIGIIIGAALTTLAIGYHLDRMQNFNKKLEVQLLEKEEQIKALEDKMSEAQQWLIVKEVEIEVEMPERNFANQEELILEIEKEVKKMIKTIRGKKVQDLDPLIVRNIVQDRQLNIFGYNFVLDVHGIIVAEKIVFYIYAIYKETPNKIEPM